MMRTWIWLVLAASLMGCHNTPAHLQPGADGGIRILRHFGGGDSQLTEAVVMVINSKRQRTALGSPAIDGIAMDFNKESLLVVAVGEKPTGGYWVRIDGVQLYDNDLYFQGTANAPSENDIVTQALTYPWAAAVIPRVADDVTLHPEIESVAGQSR
jgi:hypothetical protein